MSDTDPIRALAERFAERHGPDALAEFLRRLGRDESSVDELERLMRPEVLHLVAEDEANTANLAAGGAGRSETMDGGVREAIQGSARAAKETAAQADQEGE